MKFKRNITSCILLITFIVMTSVCAVSKDQIKNKLSDAKTRISNIFTKGPNAVKKKKTGSFARKFYKVVGFAPIAKENDVDELSELIATEADLIKIGAFKKLNKLSNSATDLESKKKLILAKLQGAVELIKYYGAAYNFPKTKLTFAKGFRFVRICKKLHEKNNSGDCVRKKIQLIAAFIFSHKIEVNRFTRFFLAKAMTEAKNLIPNDKMTKFIYTKLACEEIFAQDEKNVLFKTAMKVYMGTSKKDKSYNCVTELLKFENDLKDIDSYPGEFHYLLAKAYGHQNDYGLALKHLRRARSEKVVDSKTREVNRKTQLYYEKIYLLLDANFKKE